MKAGKIVLATLATGSLVFGGLGVVLAQTKALSPVLIVEVQTESKNNASQEFIELANTTDGSIDISEWRVEYFAANPKSFDVPTRTIPLHGSLPAGAHYLLASVGYLVGTANDSFSSGLSNAGGHLLLVSPDANTPSQPHIYDALGWGTAVQPETTAALVPKAGESLQRKVDDDGFFTDTDDNQTDFISGTPNPEGFVPSREAPEEEPTSTAPVKATGLDGQTDETESADVVDNAPDVDQPLLPSLALQITELLPNPASPQTDAADEFIELYNPNSEAVELTGYKLQTGTTYSHSYEFVDQTLDAQAYKAFYVTDTGVVLANSASKARLIDPTGAVMSETADYTNAPDGQAWVWDGGSWAWSTMVTPNAPNQIGTKETALASSKATSTKKAATTKPKTARAKTTSAKVKSAKTSGSVAGSTPTSGNGDTAQPTVIHPAILAAVGGLALLYGLYEYRSDIANSFQRLKNHRANRRALRAKA